jgi:hypothetical protein
MGTGALKSAVKRPAIEADNSTQSSAEIKMVEVYFHSTIRLHGVVLYY